MAEKKNGAGSGTADEKTTAADPAAPAEGGAPPLVVNAQFLKDLSFENPNAPQSLVAQKGPPQVEIQVNVGARNLAPNIFEVTLSITGTAKQEAETVFLVECAYGGVFTLTNVPTEHIHPLLMIEGPRLLFPFARSIIADATRDGGFPPLMIQPIDFVDLYRRQAAAQQAQQPTQTA